MSQPDTFSSNASPDSGIHSALPLPFDEDGGIDLSQLDPGTILEVRTRNNAYVVIPQAAGEVLISGHAEYCPEPTLITGLGASYSTGLFREGYLCPGMKLCFPNEGRRVSTSRIISLKRLNAPPNQ